LQNWAEVLSVPEVDFFSLQIEVRESDHLALKSMPHIRSFASEALPNFAETAALIANLDLVISVDTAVAHLAGAMAKPVWLLLPLQCDWRWMREALNTPWYGKTILLRQLVPGSWAEAMTQVAIRIRALPQIRSDQKNEDSLSWVVWKAAIAIE
jgi:hypothetical protein